MVPKLAHKKKDGRVDTSKRTQSKVKELLSKDKVPTKEREGKISLWEGVPGCAKLGRGTACD